MTREIWSPALQRTGFQVILEQNLSKEDVERAVAQFARLAQDADVALFYCAGHGMQFGRQNYLVPVPCRMNLTSTSRWPVSMMC
jgi:uncharacterized caspase-like protein